jgi:short-subunit dehydrogenase
MSAPVIWITGASSGIGEASAKRFSQAGYRVILSARNEKELNRVKMECLHPESCAVLPLDLGDAASLAEKVSTAIAVFGQIDVMLHNGGISQRSLTKETLLDIDRRIMEINYFGTIALTKALLPHFNGRNQGHFAVISSLVGKFGSPYRSSYSASKHALHGFFDSLRAEQHAQNLAVTLICPGFIRTQVSVNALTGDGSQLGQMDQAQANGMSPEDCAQEIFVAIAKKKNEVYIGGKEKYYVLVKRLFPDLFAKLLTKAKVR